MAATLYIRLQLALPCLYTAGRELKRHGHGLRCRLVRALHSGWTAGTELQQHAILQKQANTCCGIRTIHEAMHEATCLKA